MRKQWADWAPLPLRLVLGFGFAYHGFPKVFSTHTHAAFAGTLEGMELPLPDVTAWGVGLFEFFGGLALIVGVLITWVAALGILEMLYAMFMVHLSQGFNFIHITGMTESGPRFGLPGYEVNLLYLAGFATLFLLGAGAASVDRARGRASVLETVGEPTQEEEVTV